MTNDEAFEAWLHSKYPLLEEAWTEEDKDKYDRVFRANQEAIRILRECWDAAIKSVMESCP